MKSALEIVLDWHTALNAGEVDRMVALVDPNVEIGGPKGLTHGAEVVREWFGRANVKFHPLRSFQRDEQVVVEARGDWHDEAGNLTGSQNVSTHFVVTADTISRIMRYDELESALNAAGLQLSDEVRQAT
jgi:hypothetical protein